MTIDERIAIAEEAGRLEAAGLDWEAKHVAALLGCSRSAVYDTGWLRACSHLIGHGKRRWTPAEFRAARSSEQSRRDSNDFFRRSGSRQARRRTA